MPGKKGNSGTWFPGNFDIWRKFYLKNNEILKEDGGKFWLGSWKIPYFSSHALPAKCPYYSQQCMYNFLKVFNLNNFINFKRERKKKRKKKEKKKNVLGWLGSCSQSSEGKKLFFFFALWCFHTCCLPLWSTALWTLLAVVQFHGCSPK